MKTVFIVALLCAATGVAAPPQTPISGLELANFDRSVRPQDDLFRYVNGGWLAKASVPPERVTHGTFAELTDRAELQVRAIVETVLANPDRKPGSPAQQIADLYLSIMDEARLEAQGAAPLRPVLARLAAIQTTKDVATEAGVLTALAGGGPFAGNITVDAQDPAKMIVQVAQGGTLLPDRDYYLKDDPLYVDVRARYVAYVTQILTLAEWPQPAENARAVLALETALARAQWSPTESRDATRTYNPYTLSTLSKAMPGFDWQAWARPQGIDRIEGVSLTQPSFFKTFAALVPATPLDTWKAWLATRYITAAAPYVSQAFNDARFEFFGRLLTGQEEPRVRWKRGVSLVSVFLGDLIGRMYVERHFPPTAKARMQTLVDHMVAAYRQALQDCDWMSNRAKASAGYKLSMIATKVGYPDQWRKYNGLEIRVDDLLGNVQRSQKFQADYRVARLREPADRREWLITPQTVNAYYNAAMNEIVLPAAILQPPLFNVAADDAVNYGAIGGVIGHELTHAFDNQGRAFDGTGAVRNWWTPQDEQGYGQRARRLVDQFQAYQPIPDVPVNGLLTLSENVGDLAGLSIAYQAYLRSLKGKPSPVIDGFTGEQRVFLGWAQAWRSLMRDGYLRQWLLSTPYAPPEYRTNVTAGNVAGFYAAFGVKEGDRLFRRADDRIKIW